MNYFRLIMENNPHPMWIYDHRTLRFQEVNRAAISRYGYSREEFLKMKITDIRPRQDVQRLLTHHKKFRLNRKHIGEWKHLLKDGRIIDVEITAYPLHFDGRGAVLVQAQDLSKRKHAQEVLQKLTILEERNRMAREIHDTLAQGFTGILLQLEAAQDVLSCNRKEAKAHIVRARNLAKQSLLEARRSLFELRPQELQRGDLTLAIQRLANHARRDGVPIHCSIVGNPRSLSKEIEMNLLRIAQEALTNVIKHAQATRVNLSLSLKPNNVQVIVQDNGKGFTASRYRKGYGLISMQERANHMGARLTINSTATKGTRVTVAVQA